MIRFNLIPQTLREKRQWIVWDERVRDGQPQKIPAGKTNDSTTWTDFASVCRRARFHTGIGFVFSPDDPFCGIDLDGCRDPGTGQVAQWARTAILRIGSYAEVSPSGTGIKIWVIGKNPFDCGKRLPIKTGLLVPNKRPALEIYDRLRYFAVTGWRLKGLPIEPRAASDALRWIFESYQKSKPPCTCPPRPRPLSGLPIVERARRYMAKIEPAVSGQGGHTRTFKVAIVLVRKFELDSETAMQLLLEYNRRCDPPWTERELRHKIESAAKQRA